ncbi:hypothetical protein [Staphylococcus caeli]|uniref:Peptidase propeptide and YPEB domain-containing protein n=1 Tax=Staphylococcus caeli TaxID=2201815 RepID=A0A1D4JNJ2_9STAP|nr:hypothetical protein [Staphylococcus caeli]SCS32342.1 peptidase propeptide and YPEB domain-containing protein [Staphylococcus caeli]SCS63236.1 peptidase propeptide and YPEB domain-containing protein [Staphylococcus caeli]
MLNKKNWFIILFISLTAFVGSIYFYKRQFHMQYKDPDKITAEIKTYFMNVVGSYILKEPITYNKNGMDYNVFQGGITTRHDDTLVYYTFYADAISGEIIDICENE